MKERPILFSAPMVRALLNGTKTQTRRAVKPQPEWTEPATIWQQGDGHSGPGWYVHDEDYPDEGALFYRCPHGQPGDQLWVRETFTDLLGTGIEHRPIPSGPLQRYVYAADIKPGSYGDEARKEFGVKWKPSIFMPRAASRITLEITAVRVERLQDISGADAQAEGIVPDGDGGWHLADTRHYMGDPISSYASLWEYINGPDSWDLNPWVWVIEFRKVTP